MAISSQNYSQLHNENLQLKKELEDYINKAEEQIAKQQQSDERFRLGTCTN